MDNPVFYTDKRGSLFYDEFTESCVLLSVNPKKHTFRGMHYQVPPFEQKKQVYCISGKVRDYGYDPIRKVLHVVDLRPGDSVIIERGWLHGFLTLRENTTIAYYLSSRFSADHSKTVRYSDVGIKLPKGATISAKDNAQTRV